MKKFPPTWRTLKNGHTVLIRECTLADTAGLLATVRAYIRDSEYISLEPGEFQVNMEEEKNWVRSFIRSDNSLLLLAIFEGNIIGNIDLTGGPRRSTRHTGVIGMGLLKEWRGTGLGTTLLGCVIDWARKNPVLELVWLQVYSDNAPARALYGKAGFAECGVQKNFFKTRANSYADNITMMMKVK